MSQSFKHIWSVKHAVVSTNFNFDISEEQFMRFMPKLELHIYVMYICMCTLYTYTYLCECIHMCVYRVYTNTRYIKSQGKIIPTPGKF